MASVVYLNVAMKVAYWLLFESWFKGPSLNSFKGRFTGEQANLKWG